MFFFEEYSECIVPYVCLFWFHLDFIKCTRNRVLLMCSVLSWNFERYRERGGGNKTQHYDDSGKNTVYAYSNEPWWWRKTHKCECVNAFNENWTAAKYMRQRRKIIASVQLFTTNFYVCERMIFPPYSFVFTYVCFTMFAHFIDCEKSGETSTIFFNLAIFKFNQAFFVYLCVRLFYLHFNWQIRV